MLKYLIIILDDSSVTYCHYDNRNEKKLISAESLKGAIEYAMKQNLSIQIVWPDYKLPQSHLALINSIDHIDIAGESAIENPDIIVIDDNAEITEPDDKIIIKRMSIHDFIENPQVLYPLVKKVSRLNIVFTDILEFKDSMKGIYAESLSQLSEKISEEYKNGHAVEVNILTDRFMLDQMNNCNAGAESMCVAPDGKFYICPAFYYSGDNPVGSPSTGLSINNPQLYNYSFAPICRNCDAYHCRRCIYHNKLTTLEVNTPSHEQCVIAHLEREASRQLLNNIHEFSDYRHDAVIDKLEYLDPFEKIKS